jgi:iron complex transport system substrate-binding protein
MNYFFLVLMFSASINISANEQRQVLSCDRTISFKKTPTRAVSNDINLTEMMLALNLQSKMAGYSGIDKRQKITPEFRKKAKKLFQLSQSAPTMESLLSVNTDFFFAGWNYGMRVGGPLTPSTLKAFNIEVYELSESCIHIMNKQPASFEDVYRDLANLGTIFDVKPRASALIETLKADAAQISDLTKNITQPASVFVYDSGKDAPFTAGRYAIPNAMIEAAGGINILNDLNKSWTRTSWETVITRNPEVIIIVNYGSNTAQQKIDFLNQHPGLKNVNAIKQQRFVILEYSESTPGIRNIQATRKLAKAFYPSLFPAIHNTEPKEFSLQ